MLNIMNESHKDEKLRENDDKTHIDVFINNG